MRCVQIAISSWATIIITKPPTKSKRRRARVAAAAVLRHSDADDDVLPIKNGIPVRGDVDSFHGDLIYTYIFYGRKKRNLVKNILSFD